MISHQHKCIFIHISKCAGSSIENAFGIDVSDNSQKNNSNLFGWHPEYKLFLQHATPQQLIDLNLIDTKIWESYYKFIVIRNPWDRAFSDYIWIFRDQGIEDSFSNFIKGKGKFQQIFDRNNKEKFRADHLYSQSEYFTLNGKKINYQRVLRFETLKQDLKDLSDDLNLVTTFFDKKINISKNRPLHYSKFYNPKRKKLIEEKYQRDLELLNYKFEDQKSKREFIECLVKDSKSFIGK